MIPTIIENITEYLKENDIALSKKNTDGRLNSAENESEILTLIQRKFKINIPRDREWFDFSVEENNDFYPVNIKVTDTLHADNLSCKLGIYFALTGLLPDMPNEVSWENYFAKLHQNIKTHTDKDYYFLVINKNNKDDIFSNSLKGLQEIVPNGNNLPFQCKWGINRTNVERTHEQAKEFILKTFGDSIKLRSKMYFDFKKYFPEYV